MDISQMLAALRYQLDCVDRAIAAMVELANHQSQNEPVTLQRRGRKYMGPEERLIVSERMKRYWAGRRRQLTKGERTK